MNKQFELIQMETNLSNEVVAKKSPLLKLLKYALVGIAVFLAFVILFTVGAEKINPAVDNFVQKLGGDERIVVAETSPVAYAWTNPYSSNGANNSNYVASTGSFTWKQTNQKNTLRPTTAHAGWNWGYYTESGSGNFTIGSDGSISCDTSSAFKVQTLFYVDIYLDDLARAAIANGQITTCSVSLHVSQVGTANIYDRGTLYGTFFMCASTGGSSSAECNEMGGNDWTASGMDKFDDDMQNGRHDYSASMSMTLASNMKKIRFGVYYRMDMTGRTGVQIGGAECFAPAPTISSNFTTDAYKNGSLQLAVAGETAGGNIYPATSGTFSASTSTAINSWSGKAAFDASNLFGGTAIGDIKAVAKPGYYFSGWKITGGGLSSSHSKTSTTLVVGGGPYLKASTTTTITAYFRKINVTGLGETLTYMQELNADGTLKLTNGVPTAIKQGPSVTDPGSNSDTGSSVKFVLTGGLYSSTNPKFSSSRYMYQSTDGGSHNSNEKPSNAGQYRLIVGVFVSGTETNTSSVMGYYISDVFTINQVSVTNTSSNPVTTSGDNIPTRAYSSYAYTPTPDYVDVMVGSRPYRLLSSSDYTIGSYTNNVNVTHGTDGSAIKGAYFTFTANGNFTGQNDVYFGITHLDVSNFTYDPSMAVEIQKNYNVIYTGYEQRPGTNYNTYNFGVIAIRITGRVLKAGSFTTYDANNTAEVEERTEEKTFTIYIQTTGDANAYNNALNGRDYYVYDASGKKGTAYTSINREGATLYDYSYFYIVGRDAGTIDATKIYSNNINVCTYDGSGADEDCASFDIQLVEKTGNMKGGLTAYFNIEELNLGSLPSGVTVSANPQSISHVYINGQIKPIPDEVQIVVSGLQHYYYINGAYTSTTQLPITYSIAREAGNAEFNSAITGNGVNGQTFTNWNAYFGGTLTDHFTYGDNINVADGGTITFSLNANGNIVGSVTTAFDITPRDLSEKALGFGDSTTQTVGYIVTTGSSNVKEYAGVDANGNHLPVITTSEVRAYPNPGNTTATTLTENVDFTFSFSNHDKGVTQLAKMTITGKGNYTGSVSATYIIASMDVSKITNLIDPLENQPYTGQKINPIPETITINVNGQKVTLRRLADYNIGTGSGTNLSVNEDDEGMKDNYITITFTGNKKGTVNQGTGGNYYGQEIPVYFNIVKKSLSHADIDTYASWSKTPEAVTYTGKQIANLSLVTDSNVKIDNTLYVCDTKADPENPTKPLVLGQDYVIDYWGENINAGDNAGVIVVSGVGNYTGTVEITFKIYPRSITTNSANINIKLENGSYEYTGSTIEAPIKSVQDEGLEGEPYLDSDDYGIEYGGASDDGLIYNVDVLKGGLVTIVGKGNYTGTKTVSFSITPKAQSVWIEDPASNASNSNMKAETLANDVSKKANANNGDRGVLYADYEIEAGQTITVYAYTDAIAPLRLVKIKAVNINTTTSGIAGVTYTALEEVDINGDKYARTTAKVTFTGSGIVRLYAVQEDDVITDGKLNGDSQNPDAKINDTIYYNRGNYVGYAHTWGTDNVYSVYAKKVDTDKLLDTYKKVYGNDTFTLSPDLDSYRTLGSLFGYSVRTDCSTDTFIDSNSNGKYDADETFTDNDGNGVYDPYIVLITGAGRDRQVQVGKVGEAKVYVYHNGYVPQTYVQEKDDENAYVAFEKEITIIVSPRTLVISFEQLTIPYGVDPTTDSEYHFTYTYTTSSNGTDEYKTLTYAGGKTDAIEDILVGYKVEYDPTSYANVNENPGYSIPVVEGESSQMIKGSLYENYDISYKEGLLKVVKKKLGVSISMSSDSDANSLSKVYGEDNPATRAFTITYNESDFAYDDSENSLKLESGFLAPSLNYDGGIVIENNGITVTSNQITKYSDAGGYIIALTGGQAENYYFETVKVDFIINPANVVIKIGQTIDGEFVEITDGPAVVADYSGKSVAFDATNVSIEGLGEGFTAPKIGDNTSLTFKYGNGANDIQGEPSQAGTYYVRIEFKAQNNDNYKTTTQRFENALLINKVAPVITLGYTDIQYSGSPINKDRIQPIVSGLTGAADVGRKTISKMLFEINPGEGYVPEYDNDSKVVTSYDSSKYSETPPIAIGIYDVILVYTANQTDNYCDVIMYFEDVLEVSTGRAMVQYTAGTKTFEYNGKGHGVNVATDFEVTFTPEETGIPEPVTGGSISVEYSKDGITWSSDLPVDVGTYAVKATYIPEEGSQIAASKEPPTFAGVIVIEPYDLAAHGGIIVELEGLSFGWHSYVYDAKGHPLKDSEIVLIPVLEDQSVVGRGPKGTVSVVYYTFVDANTIKEVGSPVDVGSYMARIMYTPNENGDNYCASEAVTTDVVVEITQAGVSIEELQTTYTYSYTGNGVKMPRVYYYGVEIAPGVYDEPKGSLKYQYRVSGTASGWSEDLPVNAGRYDVLVTYEGVANDNYYTHENSNGKVGVGVIVIETVLPTITINDMVFDFGTDIAPYYDILNTNYANGFVLRGAPQDVDGPSKDVVAPQGQSSVAQIIVQYGKRYTNPTTNKIEYQWSTTPPTASGKYSVKVIYQVVPARASESNYSSNSVTKQDCLTINNIIPNFSLESKEAYYDGNRISANSAAIYDSNGNEYVKWAEGMDERFVNCYYGTLGYEYRKQGTDSWSTLAPREVGNYDVRIRYYENTQKDVFTSATLVVENALTIKQLVITVMPLYGQGNVYNGSYTDGDAIAYVYSYERDGYKYMVYSTIGNLERNEVIDISSAEYVDNNGYVYTIVTDASLTNEAWLDYYTRVLTLGSGSFVDGNTTVEFEFSELDDSEGKVAYTSKEGKDYVIDLDREIVYLNDGITYSLGAQNGYYFSIINGEGAVNVISVDANRVVDGVFNHVVAGKTTRYTINFNTLKAVDEGGIVYDMFTTAGLISYTQGDNTATMLVDHNAYYQVGEDGKAIYKHANGSAFLIDVNTSVVERIAILKVETASFKYYGYEGEEIEVTFSTSDLKSIYANNAYIGSYQISEGYNSIIDLKARRVRIQSYFTMTYDGMMYRFTDHYGRGDMFMLSNLIATNKQNVYLYYSNFGETYYVDLVNMIARNATNLYTFDASDSTIYQEVDGVKVSFEVDVKEFTYNVMRNGKLYDVTNLYGAEYDVERTALISGNTWSGSMRLGAQDAGEHAVTIGSLAIGANYQIGFVDGITYNVERAKIQIEFTADEDSVYDGQGKYVSFAISGLVNGENENVLNIRQEYDGDNINVTEAGYRTKVTVNATNYYLENGTVESDSVSVAFSDRYYVDPALMAPIVFERGEDIVYDGLKHYLELKNVERGAKVTYSGSTTAPYFREPGIYSVIATVSKDNYVSQQVELTLVITKAKYQVNALEVPGTLTYGDPLPALRCDSELGSIALDPGQVLLPTVTTYTWTFTPYNQEFYKLYEGNAQGGNTITGTIELKVEKAKANIQINGNLIQSETSPSAIVGIANGLSHNESELVTIEYVAADGTRYAKMPTSAGKYTVVVTYAGDEYHAETVYTTILTIEAESNYDWLIILGSVLLGLTILSTAFFLIRGKRKKIN